MERRGRGVVARRPAPSRPAAAPPNAAARDADAYARSAGK